MLSWVILIGGSMSIFCDSPSDEIDFKPRPLALLMKRQFEVPFGINIVRFQSFQFSMPVNKENIFFFWLQEFSYSNEQ